MVRPVTCSLSDWSLSLRLLKEKLITVENTIVLMGEDSPLLRMKSMDFSWSSDPDTSFYAFFALIYHAWFFALILSTNLTTSHIYSYNYDSYILCGFIRCCNAVKVLQRY